ncbi:XkdX family protein [Clostridium beijerinckii]|jgi:Phage uncharacterised protein (Phage_XkdX).|uniref:XkdX family protein n=2 Tax=Clostridium beijerinckii TaxID=1520 RepID=A0AAE2RUM0_CLOBE|nr:XkdX family protein [Clostridium beijerinckii]ABR35510.1 hypothetical protein Cbei_3384 [Clostridium beijerinckii NCIMB 8052]AIU05085.1 hypothetical protein Cbs_3384 [Clostridium beijerinckii ATCC 35702]MBF7809849.1 XkdX family protein [Clostridium beijerinckii]NRT69361.1 hypothetical protein [Clostridium beijerinckii]NRT84491.1 hypothetical protein [Clostridium beijerinckii]
MQVLFGYTRIKEFYDEGLWNKPMVWDAVNAPKPKLTKEQYTEITGEEYLTERPSDEK